jgi:hypothetical protein
VRSYYSLALGALLSAAVSIPASAETALSGKWTGPFNGIQVEIPLRPGPFGFESGEPKKSEGPRLIESTLQIDFEVQKKGLAAGTWTAGQFKQKFVCAQINQTIWNCVDGGGRASIEVTSPTEIKVCYLDNREGAQGAGCALLHKA